MIDVLAVDVLAQAAGDPRAGIQRIFLGVVVVLGIVMLLNYKRLNVILSLLAVIVVGATIVYAPPAMFEAFGNAGSSFGTWVANQL